ncbi:MAG TPA: penicillin-binding transpeptidase domain-containing protein [Pseudonocardiaceae bacterium]|nr:penicillin-binding transpeptidase domain-containing protein [Pseudonocardiaceae bacterium]
MRARLLLVATLLVVPLLTPLAGCGAFGPDPRDAAETFLAAVASGDAEAAGRLTDAPAAATALLRQVRDELKPERVALRVDQVRSGEKDASTASASYSAMWDLGKNRQWRYSGQFNLVTSDTEAGWSVRWSPAVLHPRLGAQQRVKLQVVAPEPAPVVDRTGTPLLTPQTVVTVALDRKRAPNLAEVAAALATALARFDPGITQQSIVAGADAAPPGQPSVVAVLREPDYQSVREKIHDLPGVSFPTQQRLLGPDRDFASTLLPGIRQLVEEQRAGATGWRIVTVDAVGSEAAELAGVPPRPVPTVTTTLDRGVQAAGEDAVDGVAKPAVIVAIQPSTGGILAVAQNAAADAQGALSLVGRYPPGSTFKIVTAAAALQAATVTPDSPVPCPATITIEGRLIPNFDRFDLGTVPLRTAFARSCNTTFARLAADFAPGQLTDAAYQMGLGRDYQIPAVTTLTGQVPSAESRVQRAENGFGQGKVLATPFGMALVASTVAAGGQVPTPALVRGMPTTMTAHPAPPHPGQMLPSGVAGGLRAMMRAVVTQGTGSALAGQPDLHGKTGTAEFSPTGSHGWFVGFRGDLAFATLVVDAGSSGPAVDVSGRFLAGRGQP